MDPSRPYAPLLSDPQAATLGVLAGTTKPLTGRAIARLSGHPRRTVTNALNLLVDHGLVDAEEAPPAVLFKLNREHIAVAPALALIHLRDTLLERLQGAIKQWEIPPVHASLFGSTARADGDLDSDVDLFIVRSESVDEDDERWRDAVESLAETVQHWTGNHAGVSETAEADLARLANDRPPIVDELNHDAITLFGSPFKDVLEKRASKKKQTIKKT